MFVDKEATLENKRTLTGQIYNKENEKKNN
jgi:hypothetical protein